MSLAHIKVDIPDDWKNLILQLWSKRRIEFGGMVIELPGEKTVITLDECRVGIEPPARVSGPILGRIRAGTTVSALNCDPQAGVIQVELNYSPIDVQLV